VTSYVPVFIGAVQSSSHLPVASAVVCPFPTPSISMATTTFGGASPLMVKGTPGAYSGWPSLMMTVWANAGSVQRRNARIANVVAGCRLPVATAALGSVDG
jgi:hypothetical protein